MKNRSCQITIIALALLLATPLIAAGAASEYMVKAAYIYNFVKFTEWPGGKTPANMKKIRICVLGENNFGTAKSIFTEASSAQLELTMRDIVSPNDASGCDVVFVSSAGEARIDSDIAALKSYPVLTISDIPNFAEKGGMIGFVRETSKIKIVINNRAVNQAQLKLDAQLLEIALLVIN